MYRFYFEDCFLDENYELIEEEFDIEEEDDDNGNHNKL